MAIWILSTKVRKIAYIITMLDQRRLGSELGNSS